MLRYSVIDGCPCPKPLYPILRKLKKETGCTFNSIYRGDDVVGTLHKYGKQSQRELYEGYQAGLPGYYPANPPTQGTHILLGDGTVGRVGAKLPWWKCGIDVNTSDVRKLQAAAKRHGWRLYRPYKTASESHHLNFARKPSRWRAFFRNVFGKAKKVERRKPAPKKRQPARPKHLSDRGVAFIASFEGFRARPYNDPAGHATIGYGHLLHHGGVTNSDRAKWGTISQKGGKELLRSDARRFETAVRDLVDVGLNQNQFDALVSFAYNLGSGALAESTLLRKLNKGDYGGARREFSRWVYAGGVRLEGLVRRRKAEASLFAKPQRKEK